MRRFFCLILALALALPPAALAAEGEEAVTRGAFVQELWALWGAAPWEDSGVFSDVPHDGAYTQAVCWAYALGLVKGTGEGRFEPDRAITREEAAVFLRRAAEFWGRDTAIPHLAECNDFEDISPWADDSLYWATDCRLMDWGPGGTLDPAGTLSAGQAEDIFARFG